MARVVQGRGSWVIDLGTAAERGVRRDEGRGADLTMVFADQTFHDLTCGGIPRIGRGLSVFGDLRLLGRMAGVMW